MFDRLVALQEDVLGFALAFDARVLSGEQAEAVVTTATRLKNALATVEVLAAARVAECGHWRNKGAASPQDWFANQTGTTSAQAKDRLETGEALNKGLDDTAAKARSGALSPEQSSAIADAATKNPEAEAELLDVADKEPVGELRNRCRQKKAEADPDPDATHARLRKQRRLRQWTDKEGAAHLHWTSTADDAAVLAAAINDVTDRLFDAARREGRMEPREAYAADALVELARRRHDVADDGSTGVVREKYLALIRADLAALVRGDVLPGEVCEIAGIGPIPVARARDLLGESILKLVLMRGRDANVTHLGRGANAAQKVALLWRSPICEVEGCNHAVSLEDDHVDPYEAVRETALVNLKRRCKHHHKLKTHKGWADADTGPDGGDRRPMVPPDDPRHPRFRPPPTT